MKSCVLLLCVLLSGCGSMGTIKMKPDVIENNMPVATNCIKAEIQRPDYWTEKLSPTATDLEYADALAHDWPLAKAYEDKMANAVRACLVN